MNDFIIEVLTAEGAFCIKMVRGLEVLFCRVDFRGAVYYIDYFLLYFYTPNKKNNYIYREVFIYGGVEIYDFLVEFLYSTKVRQVGRLEAILKAPWGMINEIILFVNTLDFLF